MLYKFFRKEETVSQMYQMWAGTGPTLCCYLGSHWDQVDQ